MGIIDGVRAADLSTGDGLGSWSTPLNYGELMTAVTAFHKSDVVNEVIPISRRDAFPGTKQTEIDELRNGFLYLVSKQPAK